VIIDLIIMTDTPPEKPEQKPVPKLPFKYFFNHFFLLHDFFHRITKSKSKSASYFDLQI
jgi:ubiquinone biosynthesis protein Coq4